jgi:pimeloyl-ACP methyl ester carboxylesterase
VRPPLLFVHGAWHGAWCWEQHFLRYFGDRGWTVKALDLRGHGEAWGRERLRWTRLSEYVEDVAAAAATMDAPPVVVGHSMGGAIVQKYLETHAAPAAVLLASVPPAGVLMTTLRFAGRHPLKFLKTNALMSLWPVVETPELAQEMLFPSSMREGEVRSFHERLQDESYLAYLDMMAFNLPKPSAVPKLPMLVVGGSADRTFTPKEVRATAAAYGAELAIFPDLAHDLMLGPGWQLVAGRVDTWLRSGLEVGVHVDVPLAPGLPVGPEVGNVGDGNGSRRRKSKPKEDLAVAESREHLVDGAVEDGAPAELKPVDERRKRSQKSQRPG